MRRPPDLRPSLGAILLACGLLLLASCTEPTAIAGPKDQVGQEVASGPDSGSGAVTPTLSHPRLSYRGIDRSYRLYVPAAAQRAIDRGAKVPLVLSFHAVFDTGDDVAVFDQTEQLADREGFVVVHPAGLDSGWQGQAWNAGHCCGAPADEQADDIGFVRALIDDVAAHDSVDTDRVYALGYSNGGMFSYRLACDLSDRIAAAGSVAGTFEATTCTPARAVPFIHVHGHNDPVVPYDGGTGNVSPKLDDYAFHSVPSSIETIRGADGCKGDGTTSTDDDVVTTDWSCRDGSQVRLVAIGRSGHLWPMGYRLETPFGNDGGYDATSEFWNFFKQHHLDR